MRNVEQKIVLHILNKDVTICSLAQPVDFTEVWTVDDDE